MHSVERERDREMERDGEREREGKREEVNLTNGERLKKLRLTPGQ